MNINHPSTQIKLLLQTLFIGLTLLLPMTPSYANTPRDISTLNQAPKQKKTHQNQTSTKLSLSTRHKIFNQANKLYNNNEYQKAIHLFMKLYHPKKWENFKVLYNIGNCYYRLRQYGYALAFYRKAQRLRPNDVNLLHNLQLLQQHTKTNISITPPSRMKFLFWYYLLNIKQLFFMLLLITSFFLLLWAVHIRRLEKGQRNLRWIFALFLTITLIIWGSFSTKYYKEQTSIMGVITKSSVTVRSGYGKNFEALFILTEADEVSIKERVAGWLRIELYRHNKDTKTKTLYSGWIPIKTIEII